MPAASPAERDAARDAIRQASSAGASWSGRSRRVFQGASLGVDPAPDGAGPGHRVRADGRHQHGPRRADGARRLQRRSSCRTSSARAGPGHFDSYFLVALPVSFLVAAAGRVVLERGVIRRLYGRPLETLLLTWGVSLIIQQGAAPLVRRRQRGRDLADVAVGRRRASWPGSGLPFNRLFIIGLARVSVAAMYWLLFRTERRPAHPRGDPEPRDGLVPGRTRRLGRRHHVRARRRAGRAGRLRAHPDRQRRARRSGRTTSSTRSWSWSPAASASSLGTILAAAGSAGSTRASSRRWARCSPRSRSWCAVILFLQRRPAGLFATRGRGCGSLSRSACSRVAADPGRGRAAAGQPAAGRARRCAVSNFTLNLFGKFLTYAILALGLDLLWGYAGVLASATACSSASAPTRWACT